jgi:hypothetical protein
VPKGDPNARLSDEKSDSRRQVTKSQTCRQLGTSRRQSEEQTIGQDDVLVATRALGLRFVNRYT